MPIWIFVSALAFTWILGFPVRGLLLRAGVVDRPNARSSHAMPTVRGGGVTMVVAILGALGWVSRHDGRVLAGLVLPMMMLAAVSFWDDLRSMGARTRLVVHALVAGVALAALRAVSIDGMLAVGFAGVLLVWIVGYTNAFNFMDGINGIGGVQALLTGSGTAAVAVVAGVAPTHPAVSLTLAVAGAAAGFLPYNFPAARMFMGDVASATLGFSLAVAGVWIARDAGWPLLIWFGLLHANFVFDTGVTLLRRVARGDRWQEAHREHFYQRLVRAGRSHTAVTLAESVLQVVVLGLVLVGVHFRDHSLLGATIGTVVIAVWAVFFAYCERAFRASMAPAPAPHA